MENQKGNENATYLSLPLKRDFCGVVSTCQAQASEVSKVTPTRRRSNVCVTWAVVAALSDQVEAPPCLEESVASQSQKGLCLSLLHTKNLSVLLCLERSKP